MPAVVVPTLREKHAKDGPPAYFTNFGKAGNPNGGGVPEWPAFDGSERYVFFKEDGQVAVESGGLRRKQCDLYREALRERMKNGR